LLAALAASNAFMLGRIVPIIVSDGAARNRGVGFPMFKVGCDNHTRPKLQVTAAIHLASSCGS